MVKKEQKTINPHKKNTERIKTAKKRTKSSTKWIKRQINDPYVSLSKEMGYRSRAAFKVIEIDKKYKIFKKGQKVVDLGSAPGGWSQVIVDKVGKGNVLALDLLNMPEIEGVKFVQQDFLADDAVKNTFDTMGWDKCDVVVSDLAANTTGDRRTDHTRTMILLEEAVDFAIKFLKEGGSFIGKVFMGGAEKELFDKLRKNFKIVKHFKPESSRKDSIEMYIVATGFKGNKKENR
jgi:23S rRNA (uridine2552-2'-O)-methyltransferase